MCDTTGLERRNRKRNLQPTNVENGDAADAAKKQQKKLRRKQIVKQQKMPTMMGNNFFLSIKRQIHKTCNM